MTAPSRTTPSARTGNGRWPAWVATAALLAAWEAGSRAGLLSQLFLPAPSLVLSTLMDSFRDGEMGAHLGATLLRWAPGLAFGAVPGLLLGLAMGSLPRLRRAADPLVSAVHPLPKIALLPLVMIMFGIGEASRIIIVGIAVFFPMLLNTMAGVMQVSPLYLEVAENYGARLLTRFTRVVLPASLPMILTGLRLAANVALLLTITVEIVMAETGLGALVWLSWEVLRTELLYATLVVISVLGLAINGGLKLLTRSLVPWQPHLAEA